jgi:hypothetical protein
MLRQCMNTEKENFLVDLMIQFSFSIEFHGSKLFTQKGSGYFHIFRASICGKTSVTCAKTTVRK